MVMNRRLLAICNQLKPTVTEATLGQIEEIDARLEKAQAAGLIKLTPISKYLGMKVEGVDLKKPLTKQQVDTVYDALIRHKVLVWKGGPDKERHISMEDQIRFSYELAEASPNIRPPSIGHTVFGHVDKYPEIYSVYQGTKSMPKNMQRYKKTTEGNPWAGYHCDITACVNPPSIGMLRGAIIPGGCGNTDFGNLAAAYETLDEATKKFVGTLKAEHEYKFGNNQAQVLKPGEKSYNQQSNYGSAISERKMVSHHPLVIVHPDTGEKILFNSPGFLKFIVGLPHQESQELLHKLWTHSVEYTISHEWSEGDLVVWDERSTTHRAPTDVYDNREPGEQFERQLYRTTLVGQPFQGLDGSVSEIVEGEPMLTCKEEIEAMMHAQRETTRESRFAGLIGNGFTATLDQIGGPGQQSAFPEPDAGGPQQSAFPEPN